MAKRMIQSPGVEINEIDLSLRLPTPAGTTIYATGFSDQGPVDEVIQVSSINEFEQIYGLPMTPAERYFYHTVKACSQSQAKLLVNRLPYGVSAGDGFGSYVSVLAYPAITTRTETSAGSTFFREVPTLSTPLSDDQVCTYFIGAPKQLNLTQTQYSQLLAGTFGWGDHNTGAELVSATSLAVALSNAAFLIINKGQTTINSKGHGYYIGLADNTAINPASAYTSILEAYTVATTGVAAGISKGSLVKLPDARLDFTLSADPGYAQGSVSQILEEGITTYNIGNTFYDDTLNIGLFKLRESSYSNNINSNSLSYMLEEKYNGSIGYNRSRPSNDGRPVNFFLENVDSASRNIEILINPNISSANSTVPLNGDGSPKRRIRMLTQQLFSIIPTVSGSTLVGAQSGQITQFTQRLSAADALFPLGAYTAADNSNKVIGNVPTKVFRALEGIRNSEIYDVDILVEGGLGTIYTTTHTNGGNTFSDVVAVSAIENLRTSNELTNADARSAYTDLFNQFANFAGPPKDGGRGDMLFIADPLRQILVVGPKAKILSDKTKIFTRDVYWALRHQFEYCNTSYAAVYANYLQVTDGSSGVDIYVPPSGFVAAKIVATDAEIGPWGAPAGFNRGIMTNVTDVAITPNQHQRDSLYQINLNPIATFADQGIVIFGQKTLLKKPSAFDRVNVRRTFLYLEKATKSVMKFFIFENNTLFTRTRVVNTLTPFFERVKAADGLYDYLIVCDERNNTPEVIDNNELIVDIYLKPVRTVEFIRVNFYATRTDANFEELAGG